MESKKSEGIGHVACTTHEIWIQHAVGYSQDKMQKRIQTRGCKKKKVLQKDDLGILTGFNWFLIRFGERQQTYTYTRLMKRKNLVTS